jgi:EAL domain-containing protein (putative c-di-GMP-specific phosphodiesterase class I)
MVMTSLETVRQRLDELSASGVRFALDDFGTGYANLEVLANVPFDFVKIDRSVLSNTAHGSRLFKLTAMVLGELGKTIVAEGVETAKQFEMVKSEGVGLVQGYYFSKPVSAEKLLELVGLPIT